MTNSDHSRKSVFYYLNSDFGRFSYGEDHVMKPIRVQMTDNLVSLYGLDRKMEVFNPERASLESMTEFHSEDYIQFLKTVRSDNKEQYREEIKLYNVGFGGDCPIFPGLYDFCQLSAGGSIAGAVKLNEGACDIAINWGGGLHHAKVANASGFCFVNDIVLAIKELLKCYQRILYIDIDIHHGDGVEEAFSTTDRVMTVSFHKMGTTKGRIFFPGTGAVKDVGQGEGKYYAVNFPLCDGIDDNSYYESVFKPVMEKIMECYRPSAIVLQCGADSLSGDELGSFNLTLKGHGKCVELMRKYNLPLLLLGGGGYTVENVARCWTYETAVALGEGDDLPNQLPPNINNSSTAGGTNFFGPDFTLHINPTKMRNWNRLRTLEKTRNAIMENLRMLPCAPAVQMGDIPEPMLNMNNLRSEENENENPDERISIQASNRRVANANDFSDSEDEGDGRRNETVNLRSSEVRASVPAPSKPTGISRPQPRRRNHSSSHEGDPEPSSYNSIPTSHNQQSGAQISSPILSNPSLPKRPRLGRMERGEILFEISPPIPLFTGRRKELEYLHEMLLRNSTANANNKKILICGESGIGKTELVRQFISEVIASGFYENCIWLIAETEETLTSSFHRLASEKLGILTEDYDHNGEDKPIKLITEEVFSFFYGRKTLFVFDNDNAADESLWLQDFLPDTSQNTDLRVIITSKSRDWTGEGEAAEILDLKPLSSVDLAVFVLRQMKMNVSYVDQNLEDNIRNLMESAAMQPLFGSGVATTPPQQNPSETFEDPEIVSPSPLDLDLDLRSNSSNEFYSAMDCVEMMEEDKEAEENEDEAEANGFEDWLQDILEDNSNNSNEDDNTDDEEESNYMEEEGNLENNDPESQKLEEVREEDLLRDRNNDSLVLVLKHGSQQQRCYFRRYEFCMEHFLQFYNEDKFQLKSQPFGSYTLKNWSFDTKVVKKKILPLWESSGFGSSIEKLELLKCSTRKVVSKNFYRIIFDCTPNLKKLTLWENDFQQPTATYMHSTFAKAARYLGSLKASKTRLERLEIKGELPFSFKTFVKLFPTLESITAPPSSSNDSSSSGSLFPINCLLPSIYSPPQNSLKKLNLDLPFIHLNHESALNFSGISKSVLGTLCHLNYQSLEELSLSLGPGDDWNSEIRNCLISFADSLKILTLSRTGTEDFKNVFVLPSLPPGEEKIQKMTKLEELNLRCRFEKIDFSFLIATPNLKKLQLHRQVHEDKRFKSVLDRSDLSLTESVYDPPITPLPSGIESLEYFYCGLPLSIRELKLLKEWAPNIRSFHGVANNTTFAEICSLWRLEELELFHSNVNDEGITGVRMLGSAAAAAAAREPNLTSLRPTLKRFSMSYCGNFDIFSAPNRSDFLPVRNLGDLSARQGFLLMEKLEFLSICASPKLTGSAEEALRVKMRGKELDIYRDAF